MGIRGCGLGGGPLGAFRGLLLGPEDADVWGSDLQNERLPARKDAASPSMNTWASCLSRVSVFLALALFINGEPIGSQRCEP